MTAADEPVLFIDRSLGRQDVATVLRAHGASVRIHDEEFDQATGDEDWLAEVGRRAWFVLSKDGRIRYRRPELLAWAEAGVGGFILVQGNLSGPQMAEAFALALPAIRRICRTEGRPFLARVQRSGRVTVHLTAQALLGLDEEDAGRREG